jgi:hypothetical protein
MSADVKAQRLDADLWAAPAGGAGPWRRSVAPVRATGPCRRWWRRPVAPGMRGAYPAVEPDLAPLLAASAGSHRTAGESPQVRRAGTKPAIVAIEDSRDREGTIVPLPRRAGPTRVDGKELR